MSNPYELTHHTVAVKDSAQARGMLHAVRHLVEVEEDR